MARLIDLLSRFLPKPAPTRPAPNPVPAPPVGDGRPAFLATLNRTRAASGLAPMQPDPKLDAMAQGWADSMARSGVMSHGDFMGRMQRTYPNTAGAENVAAGQQDVATAFGDWMQSPGHRANLLGNYNRVGLGRSGLYWCADFARV